MTKCLVDGRPVNDAMLCAACTADLRELPTEAVDLAEQLAITITRQAVMGAQQGMPHVKDDERPLPFNVNASDAADNLRVTLIGWVRDIGGDQPSNDLVSVAAWLLDHINDLRQHQAADQVLDEVAYAVKGAWRAVDRPANRSKVVVGDCIVVSCTGMLIAHFPVVEYDYNDPSTHARMTCDACQISYPAEQWHRLGREILRRVG